MCRRDVHADANPKLKMCAHAHGYARTCKSKAHSNAHATAHANPGGHALVHAHANAHAMQTKRHQARDLERAAVGIPGRVRSLCRL